MAAMKPQTVLQMIAVTDIGKYGALAFIEAERLRGREIDIAGDARTLPDAATVLSKAMERPIRFMELPITEARKNSPEFAMMLEWFGDVGYDADIAANAREYGIRPTTLDEWAGANSREPDAHM